LFIDHALKPVIPEQNLAPQDYKTLEQTVQHVENALLTGNILHGDQALTSFVNNMESHFAERKGEKLLSVVRKLLMHNDFASTAIDNASEAARILSCVSRVDVGVVFESQPVSSEGNTPAHDYNGWFALAVVL
jgi:Centromere/kinetochore protein zw10, middle domain